MENNKIITGITIILVGVFFTLANLGYISFSVFLSIFDLWPLILVVVGINIMFNKKRFVKVITWTLFFITLIFYGVFFEGQNRLGEWTTDSIYLKKPIETKFGELHLDIGASKVNLISESDRLLKADLEGGKLSYSEKYKNNNQTASITFENKNFSTINFNKNGGTYNFALNKDVIWDLDFDMGAVTGKLDLEDVPVKSLDLDLGAGNLDIILGSMYEKGDIKIDTGASNISITIPKDAGVKIKIDSALSKTNIDDLDLNKNKDYYISPNYENASVKLDLDIDMGVGKIDFIVK